ncbi:hypothetical protein SAMN02745134_00947 [Clostridium acidisoli DSM 12555]|uniref:Uncharacterized protein n=1 Tax=Clostridium acidisoli DSM 12555 TaxID=1121291 RepID=A0A1W1X7K4_9CLOT|nr:hypothetical protein [Clostridium acidisoli]SMC19813.1 hypothetical protein SAMN02745134_00947 [Clostridium acidisoli DSM 12555]
MTNNLKLRPRMIYEETGLQGNVNVVVSNITVFKTYDLILINKDFSLNIGRQTLAIYGVISHILNGGVSGRSFRDVKSIKVLGIAHDRITLEVIENGINYHKYFGRILANTYSLRNFCDQNDPSRMFEWIQIH